MRAVVPMSDSGTGGSMGSRLEEVMTEYPQLLHTVIDTTHARALVEFYRQLLELRHRQGDGPPGMAMLTTRTGSSSRTRTIPTPISVTFSLLDNHGGEARTQGFNAYASFIATFISWTCVPPARVESKFPMAKPQVRPRRAVCGTSDVRLHLGVHHV